MHACIFIFISLGFQFQQWSFFFFFGEVSYLSIRFPSPSPCSNPALSTTQLQYNPSPFSPRKETGEELGQTPVLLRIHPPLTHSTTPWRIFSISNINGWMGKGKGKKYVYYKSSGLGRVGYVVGGILMSERDEERERGRLSYHIMSYH